MELLQTPQRLLLDWAKGWGGGDCDDLSMLFSAMAAHVGGFSVGILLVDALGDGALSHAMAMVQSKKPLPIFGQQWVAVELTKEDAWLGWITPRATTIKAIIARA